MSRLRRSPQRALFATAAWLTLALVDACSESRPPAPSPSACCLADPVAHRVTLLNCSDDADCSAGTVCLDATDLDPQWPRADDQFSTLKACRGERGARVCGLPSTRSGARPALTQGFHVPAFQLTEVKIDTRTEPGSYTWQAPDGTQIVSCALFACRPAVRTTGSQEG